MCTGGNSSGTSDLGLLSSSFRLSGAWLKTFYHSLYFFHQVTHMHYGLNLRSHFGRTFYTQKLLIEAEDATLPQTKHIIKQNGP
jgi:hypothetical protein